MKYELTDITRQQNGRTLYKIRALKGFSDVMSGDLGGWVQSEKNLSQSGDCWIYDEAYAMDMARIKDDAVLKNKAAAYEHAQVMDSARVVDTAEVLGHSKIYEKALISCDCRVFGEAEVFGNTIMRDTAKAHKNAWVYGDVVLSDTMTVTEKTTRPPTYINGMMYTVTIMDDHINFDCATKSIQEWIDITDEDLEELDGRKAVVFRKRYKSALMQLVDKEENSNY